LQLATWELRTFTEQVLGQEQALRQAHATYLDAEVERMAEKGCKVNEDKTDANDAALATLSFADEFDGHK
jgi:hypothetical protein